MPRVASPPRRPSTLAIRSLWPVQVPTRETESAANTDVETRMANAAEYKRAFMWGLHASVLKSRTADVRKGYQRTRSPRVHSCGRRRRRPDGGPPAPPGLASPAQADREGLII